MSNPFGPEPPVKPVKAAKPAPANPFAASNSLPIGAAGANVAKPPKRNPFDPELPAVAQHASSTIDIAPLGIAPNVSVPAAKVSELFMGPPPLPPPLPSEPVPEITVNEIVATPTAPPPPLPSIPVDFPMEDEFMPLPPVPPPVPPPIVETPKHAPPPPIAAAVAAVDDFDFASAVPTASDPFSMSAAAPAMPAMSVTSTVGFDDFSAPPAVDDFDAFNSSKSPTKALPVVSIQTVPVVVVVEEEVMPSLPPPPPQLFDDDDPFDIHITKPLPVQQPFIQSVPLAATARRSAPSVPAANKPVAAPAGDPFLDLLPGSAIKIKQQQEQQAAVNGAVKDPKDSLPLSSLMQQQQQQKYQQQVNQTQQLQQQQAKPIIANPFAPVTAAPVKPQHQSHQPVPAPITAGDDDFGVFGQSTSSTVPPKKQQAAAVAAPLDPFAYSNAAMSFTSPAAPLSSAAVVVDDFDVFGSSQPQPVAAKPVTAAQATAAPVDDFDIFASKTTAKGPVPASTGFGNDDDAFGNAFSSLPPAQPVSAVVVEEDDTFDVFGLPNPKQNKKVPVAAAVNIFSPNSARQAAVSGFDDEDDPFAASSAPNAANNSLGAFSTDTDPMAALKAGYGLQSSGTGGDNDGFDDDFDFDNARHGHNNSNNNNHSKASSSSSSSATPGSTLQNGLPAGAPGDDRILDGDILSRLSTKAMFTKDWHDTYFVIKQGVLFLYRNRLDYQYNPNGTNYKKKFPITYNMRLLQIKGKDYKGLGTVYNFVLEKLLDYGPATLGKFGSIDKEIVQQLWKYIRDLIMFKRRDRQRAKPVYGK